MSVVSEGEQRAWKGWVAICKSVKDTSTAQCMKPVLGCQRDWEIISKRIWRWVFTRQVAREREERRGTGTSSSVHNVNHNAYIYETEASYDGKSSLKRCPGISPLHHVYSAGD